MSNIHSKFQMLGTGMGIDLAAGRPAGNTAHNNSPLDASALNPMNQAMVGEDRL